MKIGEIENELKISEKNVKKLENDLAAEQNKYEPEVIGNEANVMVNKNVIQFGAGMVPGESARKCVD